MGLVLSAIIGCTAILRGRVPLFQSNLSNGVHVNVNVKVVLALPEVNNLDLIPTSEVQGYLLHPVSIRGEE